MSLEPIDPDNALKLYPSDRENSVAQATLYSHRSRLGHFAYQRLTTPHRELY